MTKQTSTMKYRITFFTDGKKVHEETFATKEEMDRRVAEIEGKPKQTDWKCDHCKFMNPKQENTCLACGISPQSAKSGEIDCTHGNAVKWNPYNEVVQCHKCGQVFVSATELDAVRKEVAEEMTNMMANTHKRFFDSGWEKGKEDERREILKLSAFNYYTVGYCSAKREDLGTPKADPDSEYNKGYADGKNARTNELRTAIEKRGEK